MLRPAWGLARGCAAGLQVMRLIDNELSEPYSIFTYRHEGVLRQSAPLSLVLHGSCCWR